MNKYLVELIGTFFLVLTVGCTVIEKGAGPLAPLAIGASLMVMNVVSPPSISRFTVVRFSTSLNKRSSTLRSSVRKEAATLDFSGLSVNTRSMLGKAGAHRISYISFFRGSSRAG